MSLNTTLGDPAAEAYRTIAEHKLYCDARGISYAAYSDAVLEQQARKAVDYMTGQYRERWAGTRVTATQALDWPRYLVPRKDAPGYGASAAYYPSDSIPVEVLNAQSELMIRVAATPLAPDLKRGVLRAKAGSVEVDFDPNTPRATQYSAIDAMLRPLLKTSGSTVALVRG